MLNVLLAIAEKGATFLVPQDCVSSFRFGASWWQGLWCNDLSKVDRRGRPIKTESHRFTESAEDGFVARGENWIERINNPTDDHIRGLVKSLLRGFNGPPYVIATRPGGAATSSD